MGHETSPVTIPADSPAEGARRVHERLHVGASSLALAVALAVAACASAPRAEFVDQAVFAAVTVEEVREAARDVLEEVAHPPSAVRATEGHVRTEGRIGVCGRDVACGGGTVHPNQPTGTPWATIDIRLLDRGTDTTVEVEIVYETLSHCGRGHPEVTCMPEPLGSTGGLERLILEGIGTRLESGGESAELLPE